MNSAGCMLCHLDRIPISEFTGVLALYVSFELSRFHCCCCCVPFQSIPVGSVQFVSIWFGLVWCHPIDWLVLHSTKIESFAVFYSFSSIRNDFCHFNKSVFCLSLSPDKHMQIVQCITYASCIAENKYEHEDDNDNDMWVMRKSCILKQTIRMRLVLWHIFFYDKIVLQQTNTQAMIADSNISISISCFFFRLSMCHRI